MTAIPRVGPRLGPIPRFALAIGVTALSLVFAYIWLRDMTTPGSIIPPFTDANTYLAAGERLNAGHELYHLQPGDRYVLMSPETSDAALLSPPPIAVLWRPIAAVPFGFAAWIVACWVALLGTCIWLVLRLGLAGALAVGALSPGIGEQLAACNVAAFFPMLLTVAWLRRGSVLSGLLTGAMASIKLAPGTTVGWQLGTAAWRALAGVVLAGLAALALTIVGAGAGSIGEYLEVARNVRPSTYSLSFIVGVPWASYAVLVLGTLAAAAVGRRSPATAFSIAVIVAVLGTPALYPSGLVTLLAALVPFAVPDPRETT
jgi:hypothetical protein